MWMNKDREKAMFILEMPKKDFDEATAENVDFNYSKTKKFFVEILK
jgi:hypothetical protein